MSIPAKAIAESGGRRSLNPGIPIVRRSEATLKIASAREYPGCQMYLSGGDAGGHDSFLG